MGHRRRRCGLCFVLVLQHSQWSSILRDRLKRRTATGKKLGPRTGCSGVLLCSGENVTVLMFRTSLREFGAARHRPALLLLSNTDSHTFFLRDNADVESIPLIAFKPMVSQETDESFFQ